MWSNKRKIMTGTFLPRQAADCPTLDASWLRLQCFWKVGDAESGTLYDYQTKLIASSFAHTSLQPGPEWKLPEMEGFILLWKEKSRDA